MNRQLYLVTTVAISFLLALAGVPPPAHAQPGQDIALAAPIAPLNAITVPDVNELGLLDKTGPNSGTWPKITNTSQKLRLQQLGKSLFWDMQVGGDGIQACASCHYHAGADNRRTNQMSPGLKRTTGGVDPPLAGNYNPDVVQDLFANPNATLTLNQYSPIGNPHRGLPVSEAQLAQPPIGIGNWTADAVNGTPGIVGTKGDPLLDVNDVVSSQGVRSSEYLEISGDRVDTANLEPNDPGFNLTLGSFTTVRRVEPRNSPTALNAIYNMRNFWDGRADMFFNGVNPLGFRDPGARVKAYVGTAIVDEKLRIPFSSLASQAVGPIESVMEMVGHVAGDPGTGRSHRDLGIKLLQNGLQPLSGQSVSSTDSLLGPLRAESGRGLAIPDNSYATMIRQIFDQQFWGDGEGNDVCLDASGNFLRTATSDTLCTSGYTLMEWNFSMFFGLAVQAYEATLTTEQTIVDLLVGGVATGSVTNTITGRLGRTLTVPVTGLPLEGCIARAAFGNGPAAQDVATALCTQHYAQFIHPKAVAGSEAGQTRFPVEAGTAIGGCSDPGAINPNTTATNGVVQAACAPLNTPLRLTNARNALLAIDRGMGRFFAGATGCGICHFNPEFTGATVSALTGFGAAPAPPLPPGQVRRIPLEVPLERMIAFNGAPAVYDAGFYNIGVRPTPEDLSLGAQIGGVPLAFSKLAELIALLPGPLPPPYDSAKIAAVAAELGTLSDLLLPTSPLDLTPRPFTLALACGPGLVGNGGGNANNNPNAQCVPNVIPGERLLRNGAFKSQGLRNAKFTGPYMHNGGKLNLRQVVEFYKTAGNFPNLNVNNLDAGMRIFNLGVEDEAALVEMMETGLTDWRVAYEEGKFDHPEICVPHGHAGTGETRLVGIPAVGSGGSANPLQTFEEQVRNLNGNRSHALTDPCTVIDEFDGPIEIDGKSTIDLLPEF